MNDLMLHRAAQLLEAEFGPQWRTVADMLGTEGLRKRVGKELTSFMAYPERGEGGNSQWRGNCSPEVVAALLRYCLDDKRYYGKDTSTFTLLDPMSGSGTSKAAADRYQVRSLLYDLNPAPAYGKGNWNALKDEVEDSADLIFFHPPYHNMIQYSGNIWGNPHPDDLSRCENYSDFLEKLNHCIRKFFLALRKGGRLMINPDVSLEEQISVIQQAITTSGMLKEMSYTLSKLYDVELLHRQALKLRTYIEDALYPYIALQDCLVVDMERIEDTPIIYNTITQKVYENGQWSKQDLDLHGKLLIYVKSSPPMPAATEQINNGF